VEEREKMKGRKREIREKREEEREDEKRAAERDLSPATLAVCSRVSSAQRVQHDE